MEQASRTRFKPGLVTAAALAAFAFGAGASVWASANGSTEIAVSQKGRQFNPMSLTVDKDQTFVIINDDADLLHHAYVESSSFNFDSGDQKPGSRTTIAFPVSGDFKVLCGIHPKMKLLVHVR